MSVHSFISLYHNGELYQVSTMLQAPLLNYEQSSKLKEAVECLIKVENCNYQFK